MQRVTIVGLLGAGKTTLAFALGNATGLEVVQTDKIFLASDGAVMSPKDQRARLAQILDKPAYILEGAHGWTFGPRLARCDTVIWVDIGFVRRALNAFRRRRAAFREHRMTSAKRPISAARFWGWFLFGHVEERKALLTAIADRTAGDRLVRLRSFAEVQTFLERLKK